MTAARWVSLIIGILLTPYELFRGSENSSGLI